MKKKFAVITATRAEYGLLYPLIMEMEKEDSFDCRVLVTGTHLVRKYGYTVENIEKDGIPIQYRIPVMDENTVNPNRVIANAIIQFSEIYEKESYDAIIILGDRYELYGFAIPALIYNIPIIHIHGGEKTEGAIDEKIRHSITKMASVHFPSIEQYAKRIEQMGESPDYIFAVGALGIDNALKLPLLTKKETEEELQVDFSRNVSIVTFHPVTTDKEENAPVQIRELMEALISLPVFSVITMPNSDMGGELILDTILKYAVQYPGKIKFVKNLGQLKYLSCLKYASVVIGNSSSGIIETASFAKPTVDIGDRQQGRFFPENVLHCECKKEDIVKCVRNALSDEFKDLLTGYQNPYGDGNAAGKIVEVLRKINLAAPEIRKKKFNDISF